MIKLYCKTCGTKIYKYPSQIKLGEGKYCSKQCYTASMKGIDLFKNKQRGKKPRIRVDINCKFCGKLFETVPSQIGIRKYCSMNCMLKDKEPMIKGLSYLRSTETYKQWRLFVYARDGFKCQSCGQVGKDLEAHHMVPVAVDVTAMFDTENGVTLCKDCHKIVHKHYKPKTKQGELLEPLNETISSQAWLGIALKVQRLEAEARTASNASTSALHESDDIV